MVVEKGLFSRRRIFADFVKMIRLALETTVVADSTNRGVVLGVKGLGCLETDDDIGLLVKKVRNLFCCCFRL